MAKARDGNLCDSPCLTSIKLMEQGKVEGPEGNLGGKYNIIYLLLGHGIWNKVDESCIPIQDSLIVQRTFRNSVPARISNPMDNNILEMNVSFICGTI